MNLKRTGMLLLAGIFSFQANAQEKYSKVSIPIQSLSAKSFVYSQLGLDHYEMNNNAVEVVLNSNELSKLRASGHNYRLLIDDVVANTIEINRDITPEQSRAALQSTTCQKVASIIPTPPSFGLGGSLRLGAAAGNPGYFTYAEMITKMNALAAAHPDLITVYAIGNSANGQAIYGVKISDNAASDESEPEVLYTGLQHAREAIGGTSLIFFMQYLVENYGVDSRIKDLVDNRELFVIPCLNPDGYAFNYGGSSASYPVTGGGLWRKNRRNTGGGAFNIGVDLNRNYGVDWGNCAGATSSCGSSDKTDETYFGTSAFSEPETQALRNFVFNRRFVNAIDQHCYGAYYSLPYGRPSLHTPLSHTDSAYYTCVPAMMGLYNGHRAGNSPETVNYEVAGGIKDWLLMGDLGAGTIPKGKIFGMTGEAGGGAFWAPVSQLMQLCKELCFQNLQLAYAAGDYNQLEDKNDVALTSTTGKLRFSLKRIGLGGNQVTVSVVPIQNIDSVGPPVTKMLGEYYDIFSDSIGYSLPLTFVCGQTIKFAWKVEAGGITTYDTITKFYNPLTLLADDMEGSFAGNWIANPTGAGGWGFSSLAAYSGSQSMAESTAGNYSSSSTRTVTYKNTLDLSDATTAYLSFWTKYRAENFRDKLQVQLSKNGSTWVPVCTGSMIAEDNTTNGGTLGGQPAFTGIRDTWSHELFNLEDYLGEPSVSLRFRFTSDNDASAFAFERDEGFSIDDLKLVKTTNVSTLAVKFGNFNAQLQMNRTVRLNWEAYTDQQHDYFEVQRATDKNSNFLRIAKLTSLPPYSANDFSPETGNNYYRIKEVDKNGGITYSNVIKINVQNDVVTNIYPNPASKVLSVRLNNFIANRAVTVLVTDAEGRQVLKKSQTVQTGSDEIRLDIQRLPNQVYFVRVLGDNGQPLLQEKFIKQ